MNAPGVEPGPSPTLCSVRRFDADRTPIPLEASRTPDSVLSVICLAEVIGGDNCLAECDSTSTLPLRREPIALTRHRSHPPCSQLDIHPAAAVSCDAGRLLPHRFTPGSLARVGMLSVAVVVKPHPFPPLGKGRVREGNALACCFARQPHPLRIGSREVPLARTSDGPLAS